MLTIASWYYLVFSRGLFFDFSNNLFKIEEKLHFIRCICIVKICKITRTITKYVIQRYSTSIIIIKYIFKYEYYIYIIFNIYFKISYFDNKLIL